MKILKASVSIILPLLMLVFTACGGSGGSGTGGGTGTLSVSLADNTIQGCKAVYVTIDDVLVHAKGGWRSLKSTSPHKTHNLLELRNGVREELGIAELAAGYYNQMRLLIGDTPDDGHFAANYIIDDNDEAHELKIPSGYETGIKIVHGFNIGPGQTTELILDFWVSDSIVMPGHNGEWLLKPTIKVLNTDNYSIISGNVSPSLGEVLVSAQIYDGNNVDREDMVFVQASTLTEDDGSYSIFLLPGTYNIIAYIDDYAPACVYGVDAIPSGNYPGVDLVLQSLPDSSDSLGTVGGSVNIQGGINEEHVSLSFRQAVQCGNEDIDIEVKSVKVAQGGTYSVSLPEGSYYVVAQTIDGTTVVHENVSITALQTTTLDIDI